MAGRMTPSINTFLSTYSVRLPRKRGRLACYRNAAHLSGAIRCAQHWWSRIKIKESKRRVWRLFLWQSARFSIKSFAQNNLKM